MLLCLSKNRRKFVIKKMRPIGWTFLVLASVFLVGCGTLDTQPGAEAENPNIIKVSEDERIYRAAYDKTFRSAVDTLRQLDHGSAKLVRYNEGLIVFQRPDDSGLLTVSVTKEAETTTRVNMSAKIPRKYWVDGSDEEVKGAFFEELDRRLGSLPAPVEAEPDKEPAEGSAATAETVEPAKEQAPENIEQKDMLLARISQVLEMREDEQFLKSLSYEELSLLESRLESLEKKAEKKDEVSGKCAACYIDLARLYHDSGQFARAAEALKTAVAVEPNNAVAHCNLGEIYKHLNLVDDAIRELNVAQTLSPELADIYINLGIIYDDYLNDDRKALEYYQRYLSLGGSDQQVLSWIGEIENGLAAR